MGVKTFSVKEQSPLRGALPVIVCLLFGMSSSAQKISTLLDESCGDDLDCYNGSIFSTDYGGNQLRKISPNGEVQVLNDSHSKLGAIALSPKGEIYATQYDTGLLFRISDGIADTLISGLKGPAGIGFTPAGNLIINQNAAQIVTEFNPSTNGLKPLTMGPPLFWNTALTVSNEGTIYVNNMWTGEILKIEENNTTIIAELPAKLDQEPDLGYMTWAEGSILALHMGRNVLYSIDPESGFYKIVAGQDGVAGHKDGDLRASLLDDPIGIAYDQKNKFIYITDGKEGDKRLRKLVPEDLQSVLGFAGNPIKSLTSTFTHNEAVALEFRSVKSGMAVVSIRNEKDEKLMESPIKIEKGMNTSKVDLTAIEGKVFFVTISFNEYSRTFEYEARQ